MGVHLLSVLKQPGVYDELSCSISNQVTPRVPLLLQLSISSTTASFPTCLLNSLFYHTPNPIPIILPFFTTKLSSTVLYSISHFRSSTRQVSRWHQLLGLIPRSKALSLRPLSMRPTCPPASPRSSATRLSPRSMLVATKRSAGMVCGRTVFRCLINLLLISCFLTLVACLQDHILPCHSHFSLDRLLVLQSVHILH